MGSDEIVMLALPLEICTVPSTFAPEVNVTEPKIGWAHCALTTAVNLTDIPSFEGWMVVVVGVGLMT